MLDNLVKQFIEYAIDMRRYFHTYPELSGKEINTFKVITEELRKMNIMFETVGEYGALGILESGKVDKTLVLRADMDALPIIESEYNIHSKRTIISKNLGVSHMCGHDCHMAIMLTIAKILSNNKDMFNGRILFCFESGEENGSGVDKMIESISRFKIDGVWALHVYADLPTGMMSVNSGIRMSGSSKFDVTIKGKGGHGSRPDQTIDPINCTAQILCNLLSITSRIVDPRETVVLTIGKLHAGNGANIIPEDSNFAGTIRYYNLDEEKKVRDAFYRIVNNIAEAYGCSTNIKYDGPKPPVVNDKKLSKIGEKAIEKAIGKKFLIETKPWMASDTIGRYTYRYPGVYAFLGIQNQNFGSGAPHHNSNFDVDEESLGNGIAATIQFVIDFFKGDYDS